MPNRIIKESICTSDNLNTLSLEAEVFFYRLIVNCDDYGRMDARPIILRTRCFPLRVDKMTDNRIANLLQELVDAKLIAVYDVQGERFLQMKTWEKHQQVRARRSKYPDPDGNQPISEITCNQMIADDSKCPRNPIQSNPNPKGLDLPNFLDKKTWDDFVEMRTKIKKPLTRRAITDLWAKLGKLQVAGDEPNEVLAQSILNCWQDVFPIKRDTKNPKRGADGW